MSCGFHGHRRVAAGGHAAPNAAEDSVDLLPILLGKPLDRPVREATVHHGGAGKLAIRRGDWVLINAPTGEDNTRGESQWFKDLRGYAPHDQPGELFNLPEDLSERRNLYAERPELVRALKDVLEKIKRNGRSTPGPAQKNDTPIDDGGTGGKPSVKGSGTS